MNDQADARAMTMADVPPPKSMNPFEGDRQSKTLGAVNNTEVHRAVAEVQAAIMLAKQFPRNKLESMDRILNECCRPTLADSATYSYTKGKEEVTGPSIRLAEVIAANWGNFKYGWKETGRQNGVSEITTFAWDYETNVQSTREFSVRHWRDTKSGGYAIKSERDIYELCANQAARRMRACILNVIPGDVIDGAIKQCDQTLVTGEVVTPDKTAKMVRQFADFGITKEHIESRLGCKLPDMTGASMVQLRKIYNGLKEGMSRPSEFFDVPDEIPTKPASDITSLLTKNDKPTHVAMTDNQPDPNCKIQETKTPRLVEDADWWSIIDELAEGLNKCKDMPGRQRFLDDHEKELDSLRKAPDTMIAAWNALMITWEKAIHVKAA